MYSLDILFCQFGTSPLFHVCLLTCIHISQETGKVVWYSHLFKNFPQFVVIHIVKGFSVNKEAQVSVFLELPCFLHDLMNAGNLISGSSAFSKTSLNTRKFTVHILLKPGLENLEHYFTSMWDECSCAVVWAFWYCHLLNKFLLFVVINTVKDFGIVNKAEIDVFLELSCFFYDPMHVGNLFCGSSGFSKSSLDI